ncbi:hypothetical protein BLA24_25105 [Streptomyces cinnamoneus]|uniref:Uncharacterized protein n=1 Tax=Streptomyces cinnamoneus TaxID=53446 RepID=A0A2G1XDL7_STRCJ|nr:hypothetical protein [Streptomyces cinnamoneus]PHQ49333.1 hypothetical protein BLA24_25105 [Streptomyces cinnamoneus]PPT15019.1 hypothetical protein CYQ11_20965 [Streptomyces cinnamoneus]
MISFIASNKMTDRQVGSASMLGFSAAAFQGTGLPGAMSSFLEERPTKASAVKAAAVAQAKPYALAAATNGAGSLNAQHQLHTTWAFRGLEPWRDPA